MLMRRTLPLTAFLALIVVPGAQAATPDKGLIRAGKGMAGVTLGQTQAQVKAVLGTPASTKTGTNDFGKYTILTFPGKLTTSFQGNTALTSVSTTDDGQRTKQGIHVGSSETRLMQKIPAVRCVTESGNRSCSLGEFQAGRRVTVFFVKPSGLINRITVGTVID
jgi:hypothetical protein